MKVTSWCNVITTQMYISVWSLIYSCVYILTIASRNIIMISISMWIHLSIILQEKYMKHNVSWIQRENPFLICWCFLDFSTIYVKIQWNYNTDNSIYFILFVKAHPLSTTQLYYNSIVNLTRADPIKTHLMRYIIGQC